jgi:hypothetical protein
MGFRSLADIVDQSCLPYYDQQKSVSCVPVLQEIGEAVLQIKNAQRVCNQPADHRSLNDGRRPRHPRR